MSNDDQTSSGKSTTAAMTNGTTRKSRKHPWHVPYLKTCIIKDCRTKPYYDGSTYFTCCLSCLREKKLGPFFRNPNPRLFNAATSKPVYACEDQLVSIFGITLIPAIVTLELPYQTI